MYYFGTYFHNLDDKSRLTLPTKFRDKLSQVVYVTKGFDHCLNLFTEETFNKKAETYASLDELSPEERQYARTFFACSCDYEIDKNGRITLSKEHLQKAGITKEVVLVGNNDHIELWDKETYSKVDEEQNEKFEENARVISANRRRV